ncbi:MULTISPECIES: carbohydrate ABC transporter permease [Shouchella]|uniref:Sugar ABC transporter permease n=1 Tax=Shouchella hunanensis TaxID=766894 RepID=A0ABY7W8W8_9BACI|nr:MULTISPECIES: sugar ABC transporter permease [Shouchella]WDF05372.1 sugar ABC transporter permease [Shouchella hunanensis]
MNRLTMKTKKTLTGYGFILPWIIGFAIFTAFPLFYSIYLSFHDVIITPNGIQTTYTHFSNYTDAFVVDSQFVQILVTYLREFAFSVPVILVFSLIIALLLNQPIRFRGLFRMVFFLPVIIISGPVVKQLIDQEMTSIPVPENNLLFVYLLAGDGIVSTVFTYLMDNLVMTLWFSGVQILIFLAALQKIDRHIYEAAKIDGASNWECFWKVTLPSLFPIVVVNTIYTTVMYSIFALNGVVLHIQSHMFRVETGFGYASALSWIYFAVICLLLLLIVGFMTVRGRKGGAS